jgi:hypothetical protein
MSPIWEMKLEAEWRSLYFAQLTSDLARRKQILTVAGCLLSLTAAASVLAEAPAWANVMLCLLVVAITGYLMVDRLDWRVATQSGQAVFPVLPQLRKFRPD